MKEDKNKEQRKDEEQIRVYKSFIKVYKTICKVYNLFIKVYKTINKVYKPFITVYKTL